MVKWSDRPKKAARPKIPRCFSSASLAGTSTPAKNTIFLSGTQKNREKKRRRKKAELSLGKHHAARCRAYPGRPARVSAPGCESAARRRRKSYGLAREASACNQNPQKQGPFSPRSMSSLGVDFQMLAARFFEIHFFPPIHPGVFSFVRCPPGYRDTGPLAPDSLTAGVHACFPSAAGGPPTRRERSLNPKPSVQLSGREQDLVQRGWNMVVIAIKVILGKQLQIQ